MSTSSVTATQRAYTLRLAPAPGTDPAWRARLWQTHCVVNRGAAAFGDWLLTLRGGLDHRLAALPDLTEEEVQDELKVLRKEAGKNGQPEPDETAARQSLAQKRAARLAARRVLLALSWLSVEIGYTGPHAEPAARVVDALRDILRRRGLNEAEVSQWVADCRDALGAAIKQGATWVNRSAAFDAQQDHFRTALTRKEAEDLLAEFFGKPAKYLAPVEAGEVEEAGESDDSGGEEKFANLARGWVSTHWGSGFKSDTGRVVENLRQLRAGVGELAGRSGRRLIEWVIERLGGHPDESAPLEERLECARRAVGWGSGRPSAGRLALEAAAEKPSLSPEDVERLQAGLDREITKKAPKTDRQVPPWARALRQHIENQVGFPYRKHRDHVGEFAVMLDHAARRVSALHTWVKRAEAARRRFAADAAGLGPLRAQHPEAVRWLDEFCAERSVSTQSEEAYRIRPRAVAGWKEVVTAWQRLPKDASVEDRIEAARTLQDSDEIEKFGDIQLFEALADEDARCVWQSGPDLLLTYAKATDAAHKRQRFKVPAYCHPDPLWHPVFCEFGDSRWRVDFADHKARTGDTLNEARTGVTSCREAVKKAEAQLARAKDDAARASKQDKLAEARNKLTEAEAHLRWLETPRALRLDLLDGDHPQRTDLRWQSKRLAADLALNQEAAPKPAPVSRADRQGRAVAGVPPDAPVEILGLFDQAHWNCRLEAPREQLEALARYLEKHGLKPHDDSGWDPKARRLRDHVQWFVTFSAKLQPQGPWLNYARDHADLIHLDKKRDQISLAPRSDKNEWRGLAYPFRHALNDAGRQGWAKFALARLPGLRVLSVDLGHRFGAACAVWETLSPEALGRLCGRALPGPEARCHTVTTPGPDGRPRVTWLRRIGPDTLPDGTPHPAPWAKLERQFLLKLQGEEGDARKAGPEELGFIEELEAACGLAPEFQLKQRRLKAGEGRGPRPSLSVDDLMFHAVDTLRLALQRHATRARLARDFAATHRLEPGVRPATQPLTPEERAKLLTRALLAWHDLATCRRTPDQAAARLWEDHIKPLLAGRELEPRPEDREPAATRRAREKRNSAKLAALAAALTDDQRQTISRAWAEVWQQHDTVYCPLLGRLRDWLRPRGMRRAGREQRITIRHTGGLSLTRLATLRAFYQVQKAFFTRLRPDGSHPTAGESFGRRTLEALERLREQRVKQLASRIASAALGLASAPPTEAERRADARTAARLARQRLGKLVRRFAPCHAVVIESLSHYRPDQLRTRRENRQLMQWSSGKVRKFLAEACQLHGLHLREVPPAHTSRQDSRTGAPGLRGVDVPLRDFLRDGGYWAREAGRLRRKKAAHRKPGEKLLLDTFDHWSARRRSPDDEDQRRLRHGAIRLLQEGGDLFVSADPASPAARGLQADLNAAANIGLRALRDPDWPGSWWYVPCNPATYVPLPDKVKGCPLPPLNQKGQPLTAAPSSPKAMPPGRQREEPQKPVNLWRDVSAAPLTTGEWQESTAYWVRVQQRVADILHRHNGLYDRPLPAVIGVAPPPGEAGDDVPM